MCTIAAYFFYVALAWTLGVHNVVFALTCSLCSKIVLCWNVWHALAVVRPPIDDLTSDSSFQPFVQENVAFATTRTNTPHFHFH